MKIVLLYQISVFIRHGKNVKSSYNNNKFKISAPTLNNTLELTDGLYSVSDIQDYFEYILKSMEKMLMIHQYKYMLIKLKIKIQKLKMDILLNF